MDGNNKFFWYALLAGTVALSGCTSLLQGQQYLFPRPDEPSATVRLAYEHGTTLDAMTFNESGCYAGFTPLPNTDGLIEAPVAVGKELVLTYRRVLADSVCQIPFSFTPQEGATYILKSGFWSESRTGILPIFTRDQHYCGLGVIKKIGTQESVEPVQQLHIKTGFACLRFVRQEQ
ncbi:MULTISPECIES: hypothetical protein [Pseudomonas]|uniref:Lipoprotein n=1 Tax=Pseudomonas gingeri TaxID=117681 RepID=A0A7Y7WNA1_9PSED|nr:MULTISPECIES: hypothetical protein [Pseudomonas]MPQ68122.1 hypothetical protein [Pseudomonas sp. MWU12-2323]NWB84220.1 hypothetical protein [Pseudomonas gingeri]